MDNVIAKQYFPERFAGEAVPSSRTRSSAGRVEPSQVPALFGIPRDDESLMASPDWGNASVEPKADLLWRCKTRQNLTGASLPKLRRGLVRVLRGLVAMQIREALTELERLEIQTTDVSPPVSDSFRSTIRLLRAAALALQDNSLAALGIALSHLDEHADREGNYFAAMLCRLAFWQHGMFESYCSLARQSSFVRGSRRLAISTMLDLSIEASIALSQLHLATAKRLASDAAAIAKIVPKRARGLASLPACLTAEILYEEGCLDQADAMLHDWLQIITVEGTAESALRAYFVLARIARQRMQHDVAVLLLREGERLGEQRGWPRLIAACLSERVQLLLEAGRMTEASHAFESLERLESRYRGGAYGHSRSQVTRYRMLTRWRLSWAEEPSNEAVASLRQLYHECLDERNYYAGCRLAVELAQMLVAIGETEEADALFFRALEVGAAGGLYQTFLDGGTEANMLLKRAYRRAETTRASGREMLPFLRSLLVTWNARKKGGPSYHPNSRLRGTLSKRERDIVKMIGEGFSNKLIARTLQISPETVKSHVKSIFAKLSVSTRSEAVCRAGSLGLL